MAIPVRLAGPDGRAYPLCRYDNCSFQRGPLGTPDGQLLRREIDAGRLVRVSLPGSKLPIPVEDASRRASMLVISDPQSARYYVADPAGVVVLAEAPKPLPPGEKPYWMSVDGG